METLQEFPVVITVPVHWGDQDSFGHVNNVMYLRWAETARVDYLMRVGIWRSYEITRVGPIVASITCDYRRALEYPETVRVGARITGIGTSSFKMAHRIVSVTHGFVAAELTSVLVFYDYNTKRAVRLPDEIRATIAELEATCSQPAAE